MRASEVQPKQSRPRRISRSAGAVAAERQALRTRERLARVRLLEAESGRIDAETAKLRGETSHLDFDLFRKAIFFVLALALIVALFVQLLTDPSLWIVPASGLVATLTRLASR